MEWQPIDERAEIVAWLREKVRGIGGFGEMSEYADGIDAAVRKFDTLVDAVEDGDHLAQGTSPREG